MATVQALATHAALPRVAVHALPQKPQSLSVFVRSVSQASELSPSHSPRPAVHGDS
jgi:hypothetical protein